MVAVQCGDLKLSAAYPRAEDEPEHFNPCCRGREDEARALPIDNLLAFSQVLPAESESEIIMVLGIRDCAKMEEMCIRQTARTLPDVEMPPKDRTRYERQTDALHKACCDPTVTVDDLAQLLLQDPTSINRRKYVISSKNIYNAQTAQIDARMVAEPYSYPLNLALENGASIDVIEMLATADPSVLLEQDGARGDSSLLILLKRSPCNFQVVDMLLTKNPRCALVTDQDANTALHVACFYGVSEDILCRLCMFHRAALGMRNSQGHTPLMVAQKRSLLLL